MDLMVQHIGMNVIWKIKIVKVPNKFILFIRENVFMNPVLLAVLISPMKLKFVHRMELPTRVNVIWNRFKISKFLLFLPVVFNIREYAWIEFWKKSANCGVLSIKKIEFLYKGKCKYEPCIKCILFGSAYNAPVCADNGKTYK